MLLPQAKYIFGHAAGLLAAGELRSKAAVDEARMDFTQFLQALQHIEHYTQKSLLWIAAVVTSGSHRAWDGVDRQV